MELRVLQIHVAFSVWSFVFTEQITEITLSENIIQQLPIGQDLVYKISEEKSKSNVTLKGVFEVTLYLQTVAPGCCCHAYINSTGIINSCSKNKITVRKNNFVILVDQCVSADRSCRNETRLHFIVKSKFCRREASEFSKDEQEKMYHPGAKVTGKCTFNEQVGETNLTCGINGTWQSTGNCRILNLSHVSSIKKETGPPYVSTTPPAPFSHMYLLTTSSYSLNNQSTIYVSSSYSELSELSTKPVEPSTPVTTNICNDTNLLTPSFSSTSVSIGTSYYGTIDYETNSLWSLENLGSVNITSIPFTSLYPSGQEQENINITRSTVLVTAISGTEKNLLSSSSDLSSTITELQSSTDQRTVYNESVVPQFTATTPTTSNTQIFDLNSSLRFHMGTIGMASLYSEFFESVFNSSVKGTSGMTSLYSEFFESAINSSVNVSVHQPSTDNGILDLSTFAEGISVEATTVGSAYNEFFSTILETYPNNSIPGGDGNSNSKTNNSGPQNSNIALGVTIVIVVIVIVVLLVLIFRVIWKVRDKRTDSQQTGEDNKFADISPLAQISEPVGTPNVTVEPFSENLCYIDLGEVYESNTDDEVSSPCNSENSSHEGEDNTIGKRHSEMTTHNRLGTFTGYNIQAQNSMHKHNYNQKVGCCNAIKKSKNDHTVQSKHGIMKYEPGKNGDVYAVSYKKKSVR